MYASAAIRDASGLMGASPQRRRRSVPPLNAPQDFREFERIAAEREKRMCRWREVFNLMMPDRTAFEVAKRAGETPSKPVDSYPAHALQRGIGKVISALFPNERVWFEFLAGEDIPEDQHDAANEAAEKWRDKLFGYIARSEFGPQLDAMMADVFAGMGAMRVERGESIEDPLSCKAVPLNELYPITGIDNALVGMFRKYECPCGDIEEKFSGSGRRVNIPDTLRQRIASDPKTKVCLLEKSVTVRGVGQRFTVYLFEGKDVLVDHTGSDPEEPSAWVIVPWRRVAGEAYGRGPADRALETARYYNHARDVEAKAHDRRVDPAHLVDIDSGITADTFRPIPRAVIPYSSQLLQGNPPVRQLVDMGNVSYEDAKIVGLKAQLDEILFASNTLPPVSDSHQMTAAEIRVRWMEKLREEGVDFGVLNRGFGLAFIRRALWVLQSWGVIPPILKANGKVFKIRYAGPLATAQDADDATNLEATIQGIVATVGPEIANDRVRMEDVPAEIIRKRNAPASLIRPKEEGDQREQARMQAQVAQVAAENGLLQPGQAAA